jgi:hypothetical protein
MGAATCVNTPPARAERLMYGMPFCQSIVRKGGHRFFATNEAFSKT